MLTIQFETFQMKEGESIEEMFSRLIIITNELKSLGTPITKLKKVQKLLGSLPDQWNAKVSAIEESKDLEELELDELMGILMVHEQKLEGRTLLKKNNKSVAFKTATEQSTDEEQLSNDEDEDEIAFISKQIKKMWIARKNLSRNKSGRKFEPKKIYHSKLICYGCNQAGHMKQDCPELKKPQKKQFKGKKKAMMAT